MTEIAFYAPLKSPHHPTPSGDRFMAQQFMRLLEAIGYKVNLISDFRSFSQKGNEEHVHLKQQASDIKKGIIEKLAVKKPAFWFTYHLHHKAPDWLGADISETLDIPYIVAEASLSPKKEFSEWSIGYKDSYDQLKKSDAILALGTKDIPCLRKKLPASKIHLFSPFLNLPLTMGSKKKTKERLAKQYGLPLDKKWILSVAMIRPGCKEKSYLECQKILSGLPGNDWHFIAIGDGEKAKDVQQAFYDLKERVSFIGRQDISVTHNFYIASDLYLWPAIDEAYGITILEAQAFGLPVIAGDFGSVSQIVKDHETGRLIERHNIQEFQSALSSIKNNKEIHDIMSKNAKEHIMKNFSFERAARALRSILQGV